MQTSLFRGLRDGGRGVPVSASPMRVATTRGGSRMRMSVYRVEA